MSRESLKVRIIKKAWEDPAFKARLLADPKNAIQETFGVTLPREFDLTAVEETSSKFVLVIPPNPEALENAIGDNAVVNFTWN